MACASRLVVAVLLAAFAPGQQPGGAAPANDQVEVQRAALAAAEAAHGPDSLEAAAQLVKLGQLLSANQRNDEAHQVHRRALTIREAKLPANHAQLAIARVNLASALLAIDDPTAARPLLQSVCDTFADRPPSRIYAAALTNLGVADCKLGDYIAATDHLTAAVRSWREHFPEHPFLAVATQNLAQVRLNQGRVEEARQCLLETLTVLERTEPGGARQAMALFGLGMAMARAGRLNEATAALDHGLAIGAKSLPEHHPQRVEHEYQRGWLACQQGDPITARLHLERAVAAGHGQPSVRQLRVHATLARTLVRLGELDAARSNEQIASRLAATLSAPPTQTVELLFCRAELAAAERDRPRELQRWRELLLAVDAVDAEAAHEARSALAHSLHAAGDVATAVIELQHNLRAFGASANLVLPAMFETERLRYTAQHRRDLNLLLECRSVHADVLDAATTYGAVLAWKGQVARGVHDCLQHARSESDQLPRLRRLREIASDAARGDLDATVRGERERLLTAISGSGATPRPPDAAAICARLGDDEALLDYVLFRRRDGEQRLRAFVLTHDGVHDVDLGAAAPVLQAIERHVRMTSRSTSAGSAELARTGAAAARAAVFDPLAEGIGTRRTLHIVPDGALATLPFETLPLETSTGATDRGFLVEHFAIDYLQDATRLLEPPAQAGNRAVLALGDIDYGEPGTTADAEPRGLLRPFAALPHTRAELEALAVAAGDTPCRVLRGTEASETRLRELASGATVLHLATHGYFAGDAGASGIALAGANLTASDNSDDDGILSPDEALLLDLRECRLVVLSACQSGLGTPFVGESLLGIRRNLHLAGAATTITSLWAVGDQATARLMADLHHALLQQGMAPAAALRHAQLAALARARAECGEGLPGRWGAFVCDGR